MRIVPPSTRQWADREAARLRSVMTVRRQEGTKKDRHRGLLRV
jgi:hypothetical protein